MSESAARRPRCDPHARTGQFLGSEGFDSIVVAGPARQRGLPTDATLSRGVAAGQRWFGPARSRSLCRVELDGLLRRAHVPMRPLSEALWPDADVGWLAGSVVQGLRAARGGGVGVMYGTAGRMTAHLAALIVHRLTGLPWVADFTTTGRFIPPAQFSRGIRLSPVGPRWCGAGASSYCRGCSHDRACESVRLLGVSPGDPRRVMICNRVGPDDLESACSDIRVPESRRLRLSHVGSLREWRDPTPVLAAVHDLIEQGHIDRGRFEVRVVGDVSLGRRGSTRYR